MIINNTPKRDRNSIAVLVLLYTIFSIISSPRAAGGQISGQSGSCDTLRSVARVYMAYGYYEKARPLIERAVELSESQGLSDQAKGLCLADLAYLYREQGDLWRAEDACLSAIGYMRNSASDPGGIYLSNSLRILSRIYGDQGVYDEARAVLYEAIEIVLRADENNVQAVAPFVVDLGCLYADEGCVNTALEYYTIAFDLLKSTYGLNHLYTASVQLDIADIYVAHERYEEAFAMVSAGLRTYREVYGTDHRSMAKGWVTLAKIHQAEGDVERAAEFTQRVEAIRPALQIASATVAKAM